MTARPSRTSSGRADRAKPFFARLLQVTVLALLASGAAQAETPTLKGSLAPLTAAYERVVKPGEQVETYRELFNNVLDRVQRTYAQEVDLASVVDAGVKALEPMEPGSMEAPVAFKKAINAALAALDPHSNYLDSREQRDERGSLSGGFGGLGMQVDMADGLVRIVQPMDNSPASRAGLKAGDLIVRFDNQDVQGMTLADAIARMRGEPGTPVTLVIRRSGAEDFSVPLVRENIKTQSVRARMEDDVLVLRLSSFTSTVSAALDKAVTDFASKQTPRAVILDMRGNPGGLLNQGIATADAFLNRGEIVSLRGRTQSNRRTWQADAAEKLAGVPMVVLVDGGSASAAELVASALQENGRAVVMGQRSYGKGSVQAIFSLGEDKGALRLTTALYYGPSGRTVQRAGVGPDIELVPPTPAPVGRGGRREEMLAHALPGSGDTLPPKAKIEQALCAPSDAKDQVMACALAYVKAGGLDTFITTFGRTDTVAHQN